MRNSSTLKTSKRQYPASFIYRAKSKATNIHKRTSYNKIRKKNPKTSSNTNPIKRHVILSQYPTTAVIETKLKLLKHNNLLSHNKNNKTDI